MIMPLTSSEPLTAVVRRQIKLGSETRFEELMREFVGFALKQPGHLGITVLRPSRGSREYTVVDSFVDAQARHAFTSSPEYAEWRARLLEVSESEPAIQELGGMAGWFTLPNRPPRTPPPKYKMALVTLLGVYPLSMLFPVLVRPLAGTLPAWLIGLIIAALIVMSLTWIVMPNLTRLLEKWLFTPEDERG
jgi:antibiotic biosynthesis monooxygenase (ABM) superfamily enzyme